MTEVDVLVVVAATGEDDALLAVEQGSDGSWELMSASDLPPSYDLEVRRRTFRTYSGLPFTVALTRAAAQRAPATVAAAARLVDRLQPMCLAMCGVCAGRPTKTRLGDAIVADRVYRYNTGRLATAPDGGKRYLPEPTTYGLHRAWKQAAERLRLPEGDWLTNRPVEREYQRRWALYELAADREPHTSPERSRCCPNWPEVLAGLWADGLVERNTATLSDTGRAEASGLRLQYPEQLPAPEPIRIHVGTLATGDDLVLWSGIWSELEGNQAAVRGLDMEAAAVGFVADQQDVPLALIVKGVMDYADPDREDNFREFAARVAAETLMHLLRAQLPYHREFQTRRVTREVTAATENLSESAKSLMARVVDAERQGKTLRVPDDFRRTSDANATEEHRALHAALRELRSRNLIQPAEGSTWEPGKHIVPTGFGRIVLGIDHPHAASAQVESTENEPPPAEEAPKPDAATVQLLERWAGHLLSRDARCMGPMDAYVLEPDEHADGHRAPTSMVVYVASPRLELAELENAEEDAYLDAVRQHFPEDAHNAGIERSACRADRVVVENRGMDLHFHRRWYRWGQPGIVAMAATIPALNLPGHFSVADMALDLVRFLRMAVALGADPQLALAVLAYNPVTLRIALEPSDQRPSFPRGPLGGITDITRPQLTIHQSGERHAHHLGFLSPPNEAVARLLKFLISDVHRARVDTRRLAESIEMLAAADAKARTPSTS